MYQLDPAQASEDIDVYNTDQKHEHKISKSVTLTSRS